MIKNSLKNSDQNDSSRRISCISRIIIFKTSTGRSNITYNVCSFYKSLFDLHAYNEGVKDNSLIDYWNHKSGKMETIEMSMSY